MIAYRVTVLSGARSGLVIELDQDFLTIGRHPTSHIAFDPEGDREVSIRHAALFKHGGQWVLRDLGSTNGTFVNGERIRADRPVQPGDAIRLGPLGPEMSLTVSEDQSADTLSIPPPLPDAPSQSLPLDQDSAMTGADRNRGRPWWRRTAKWIGAGTLVIIGAGGYRWLQAHSANTERTRLVTHVDSLLGVLAATQSEASTVQDALEEVIANAQTLRQELSDAQSRRGGLDRLSHAVDETQTRQQAVVRAARFDPAPVVANAIDAVGLVSSQFVDGQSFTATGFVVATRGDTGWVLTSHHAIEDSLGRPASQLGFVFHGSGQHFPATRQAVHDSFDVALLRLIVPGGVPSIAAPGLTIRPLPGDPVVILSFPLGLDIPMGGDWRVVGVSASVFLGSVSRILPTLVQIDGYGAHGSSGSPVLGANGALIGVVYGGEVGTGGRVLYAVPIAEALALVP